MVGSTQDHRGLAYYVNAWLLAARPVTLSAAVVPVLLGTGLAGKAGHFDVLLFILALTGAVFIQVGTNLADEYTDHRNPNAENKYPAPHKVIERGLLSEQSILYGIGLSFALSTAIGLFLTIQVGWPILVVGIFSILAGYSHSSGPYPLGHHLLGEITVFVFMGPLIVLASYYVQIQELLWSTFWVSLPVAFLVTAILQCNNLRDREDDKAVMKHTFATLLPLPAGRYVYFLLIFGAYGTLLLNTLFGVLPFLTLVSFATLPKAYSLSLSLWRANSRINYNVILVGTAKLHMYFGSLFVVGVIADTLSRS